MGHAAHFLRRLDRVSDARVELALTLYRDEALLAAVLRGASLAEGIDRVAISLDDPVEGPFVVVTREGRFVTCLGAGMRASDLPVLTRERLDVAAGRVQRMRDELERVRRLRESGADGQASLAFRRMQQQGPRFAREDARVLLQMQPLIEKDCLLVLVELFESLFEARERVATYRLQTPNRLSRAQRDVVLAFGESAWTVAHLIVLASSNRVRERLARGEAENPESTGVVHAIAALTFEWGTLLHAARALWFLAQGGKSSLAAVKADDRRYTLVRLIATVQARSIDALERGRAATAPPREPVARAGALMADGADARAWQPEATTRRAARAASRRRGARGSCRGPAPIRERRSIQTGSRSRAPASRSTRAPSRSRRCGARAQPGEPRASASLEPCEHGGTMRIRRTTAPSEKRSDRTPESATAAASEPALGAGNGR